MAAGFTLENAVLNKFTRPIMSKTTTSPSPSDADVLEALRTAADTDQRDLADGGVRPAQVAQYLPIEPKATADRLRQLVEAGDVVKIRGLNPETRVPRWSWLPAEEVSDDWP